MKTIICGDIHGDFQVINALIRDESPDVILQVGDFGFWPNLQDHGWPPDPPLLNGKVKIHFCDGNHEDHESLSTLAEAGQTEVLPNVHYQPRGSVFTLPDGRNVLFFGGAASGDAWRRTEGRDWFQEEVPSLSDLDKIPDDIEIDIVISHTAPSAFKLRESPPAGYAPIPWMEKHHEETRSLLDILLNKYRPKCWYFGHFHIHQEGFFMQTKTRWTALAMPVEDGEKWWVEHPRFWTDEEKEAERPTLDKIADAIERSKTDPEVSHRVLDSQEFANYAGVDPGWEDKVETGPCKVQYMNLLNFLWNRNKDADHLAMLDFLNQEEKGC